MSTSATPVPPAQKAKTQTPRYYPHPGIAHPREVYDALRRAFDTAYNTVDNQLPMNVAANGRGPVTVPSLAANKPPSNVPECQITLSRAGIWTVTGSFTFQVLGAGDVGSVFSGTLFASGLGQPMTQIIIPPATQLGAAQLQVQAQPTIVTVSHAWHITCKAGAIMRLRCQKDTGGGTSVCDGSNSFISAVWGGVGS